MQSIDVISKKWPYAWGGRQGQSTPGSNTEASQLFYRRERERNRERGSGQRIREIGRERDRERERERDREKKR